MRLAALLVLVAGAMLLLMMIDEVHHEGDHVSHLVIAPYPTLGFSHGGGEEGHWTRFHPDEPEPWYMTGDYLVLWETDG